MSANVRVCVFTCVRTCERATVVGIVDKEMHVAKEQGKR